MVESITLENFLSFKNRTTFEFKASTEKAKTGYEHIEWYSTHNKKKILKALFLFGNNGTGKSNFLNSIAVLHSLTTRKRLSKTGDDDELPNVFFRFSKTTENKPSFISISFYYKNIRYVYSIEWDTKIIYNETLNRQDGNKKEYNIFIRTFDKDNDIVKISFSDKSGINLEAQKLIVDTVIRNTSVVSIYDEKNFISENLKNVFTYFDHFRLFSDIQSFELCSMLAKRDNEHILKPIILQLLNDLGSNISDYIIDTASRKLFDIEIKIYKSQMDEDTFNERFPNGMEKMQILRFAHSTKEQKEHFWLNERMESEGTLNMIRLIIILFDAIWRNVPIAIDECAVGIHQEAFSHIIQFFLTSSKEAQVFLATQALPILNMNGYRRDTARFFDKDSETGISSCRTIDLKRYHKNLNILNSYLDNSFGGMPNFSQESIWKQHLVDYRKLIEHE